jgi:hypothetical protein
VTPARDAGAPPAQAAHAPGPSSAPNGPGAPGSAGPIGAPGPAGVRPRRPEPGPGRRRRPMSSGRLTALVAGPAVLVAVLAVAAVAVVVGGASGPLDSGQKILLAGLSLLLVLVVVAGVALAESAVRRAAADAASAAPVAPPIPPPPPAPAWPVAQAPATHAGTWEPPHIATGPGAPPSRQEQADNLGAGDSLPALPGSANGGESGDEEVFVHLSRRLQSLVHRQIELLDTLENEVEEPDLLKGLFDVDHLATRIRRHAENLAVLGGARPRRQWTRPVSVMELLRSAVSETLEYARVQVIPRAPGSVNGYAVADVIHLLAELVENATAFSPPGTRVVIRAHRVTAGLAIEIDDHGLGMSGPECDQLNALLSDPTGVNVRELLRGARIGLYVVAQLAHRHAVAIRLQPNITGGIQALVVLPTALLANTETPGAEGRAGSDGEADEDGLDVAAAAPVAARTPAPVPTPAPAPQPQAPAPRVAPQFPPAPLAGPAAPETTSAGLPIRTRPGNPAAPNPAGQNQAGQSQAGQSQAGQGQAGQNPAVPHQAPHQPAPTPVNGYAAHSGPAPYGAPAPGHHIQPAAPFPASQVPPAPNPAGPAPFPAQRQAAAPSTQSAPGAAHPGLDPRPPLPRRHPQQHLATPLQGFAGPPAAPAAPADPADRPMSPSLMADFRRGLSEGATADRTDRTTPNQEGNP